MFDGYYRRKRVLVTGHTGFKGGWISLWLRKLGASVTGLALPPEASPNLYEIIQPGTFQDELFVDIRDAKAVERAVRRVRPDFIFHLAAQSLVRPSYLDPVKTIQTNVMGTMNLLEALRRQGRKADVLLVTSDKCYANNNNNSSYCESDPLGGHDPYSVSKAACELLADAWRRSFFESNEKLGNIATARGGNVIGGGDYGTDRIVPDCVRWLERAKPVRVRNPSAVRPWQHVFDCASGYLWLGAKLGQSRKNSPFASAFNFGPPGKTNQTVSQLVEEFLKHWPGKWVDATSPDGPAEARQLRLSIRKATDLLGWRPTWGVSDAVQMSAAWYCRRYKEGDKGLRSFSLNQIAGYCRAARKQSQSWLAPGRIS
jgi:CDP-glucose 4,6-dehydratase